MNKFNFIFAFLLVSGSFATSAATDEPLRDFIYSSQLTKEVNAQIAKAAEDMNQSLSCDVEIAGMEDVRQNKETLGTNFRTSIQVSSLEPWWEAATKDIWLKNIESKPGEKSLMIKPRLHRLYSYAEGMNLYGVIALEIEFYANDQLVDTKFYRGYGTNANWAGAMGEYHKVMNEAAGDGLVKMLNDITDACNAINI